MSATTNTMQPVNNVSDSQLETLKQHFLLFYEMISEYKLVPDARFEKIDAVYRSLTGIPHPYNNAMMGVPSSTFEIFSFTRCNCKRLSNGSLFFKV